MPTRNVAILLFEDVEVLDFCGPLEVFSVTGQEQSPPPFHVYTVAETAAPLRTINGLSVNPTFKTFKLSAAEHLDRSRRARHAETNSQHRLARLDFRTSKASRTADLGLHRSAAAGQSKAACWIVGDNASQCHCAAERNQRPRRRCMKTGGSSTTEKSFCRPASAPESICRCMWCVVCWGRSSRPKPQLIWNTIGATNRRLESARFISRSIDYNYANNRDSLNFIR